jgi:O-antigen/teichoic acid export membrane protein
MTSEPGRPSRGARLARRLLRGRGGGFVAMQMAGTQVFVVAINMATGIITARLLGASGRGLFAAATLWPQALLAIFSFGMPAAITYHMRGTPEARRTIFTATLLLAGILSVAATALGLGVVPFAMRNYSAGEIAMSELCVLATIPLVFQLVVRQVSVSLLIFRLFNVSSVLAPLIYLLLMLAAWPVTGVTVPVCLVALYAGIVLSTVWVYWRLHVACPPSLVMLGTWVRRLVAYALRGAVADLLSGISGYIDRLVLVFLITPELLGLYAVAYSFSRLMLVLQTVVVTFVYSKLVGRPRAEIIALHNQVFRLMAYVVFGAAVGALLLGRQVLMLFYGHEFAAAHMIFFVLTVEAALTCTGQVTAQALYALDRPGYASIAQTASFVTVLATMLLLVPGLGPMGAAIAMAAAAFVRMAVLLRGLSTSSSTGLPSLFPRQADLLFLRSLFRA